jgi:hypothetical protein
VDGQSKLAGAWACIGFRDATSWPENRCPGRCRRRSAYRLQVRPRPDRGDVAAPAVAAISLGGDQWAAPRIGTWRAKRVESMSSTFSLPACWTSDIRKIREASGAVRQPYGAISGTSPRLMTKSLG